MATVSTLSCLITQSRPSSVLTAFVKSTPPGMLWTPWPPDPPAGDRPPLAGRLLPPLEDRPPLPEDGSVWRAEVPPKLEEPLKLPEVPPKLPELPPKLPLDLEPTELAAKAGPTVLWSKVEAVRELERAAKELEPMFPALN